MALVALLLALAPVPAVAAPGDPDPSFGLDGVVTVPLRGSANLTDVIVLPDGKIVTRGDEPG